MTYRAVMGKGLLLLELLLTEPIRRVGEKWSGGLPVALAHRSQPTGATEKPTVRGYQTCHQARWPGRFKTSRRTRILLSASRHDTSYYYLSVKCQQLHVAVRDSVLRPLTQANPTFSPVTTPVTPRLCNNLAYSFVPPRELNHTGITR